MEKLFEKILIYKNKKWKNEITLKNGDIKSIKIFEKELREEWSDLLFEDFSKEKTLKIIEKIKTFDGNIYLVVDCNRKISKEKAIEYLENFKK